MDLRRLHQGMTVRSADGLELGRVLFCRDDDFVIEAGPFFRRDYRARYGQIASLDGEAVVLSDPARALEQRSAAPPADRESSEPPWEMPEPAGESAAPQPDGDDDLAAFGDAGLTDEDLTCR